MPAADLFSAARARIALAALVAIAAALRLADIDKSLYYDEMWATDLYVGESFLALRTIYRATQPPLHNLLMYAWVSVFGDSILSVRTPALLFGLGAIPLTYSLAARFRGRSAGLVAAGIMALSPNAIWWSQAARSYSMGIFLAALTVVTFHRACDAATRRSIAGYALAILALVSSHYYASAFVPPLFVAALTIPRSKRRRVALAVATALAAVVPVTVFLARSALGTMTTSKIYLRDFGPRQLRELYCWWFPAGSAVPSGEWFRASDDLLRLAIQGIFAALLILGAAMAIKRRRPGAPSGWWLVAWTLCTPALLLAIGLTGKTQFYIERSALSAMPFVFATIGCIVSPRSNPLNPGTLVLALALLYGAFVQTTRPPRGVDGQPLPDSLAMAAFLEEEAREPFVQRRVISTVSLTLAHATPLAEEIRLLESDDTELARTREAVARVLGDGDLARPVLARIDEAFAGLEAWKARRRAALRFPMVIGRDLDLSRQLVGPLRRDGVAYLVSADPPRARVLEVLEDERLTFEEIPGVDGLRLWRVRPRR